jgi:hypothetical protein
MVEFPSRLVIIILLTVVLGVCSCRNPSGRNNSESELRVGSSQANPSDEFFPVHAILVSPENPRQGGTFRMVCTGGQEILKADMVVSGPMGQVKTLGTKSGGGIPYWRVDEFKAESSGMFKALLLVDKNEIKSREFRISSGTKETGLGMGWKILQGWDPGYEELYSAWISALFDGSGEDASWKSLHEVTQNRGNNFLFNHLSLGEDNPSGKMNVIMQPDCADNPFFLRAYFAWKLGLPFGFHICDRGYPGRSPSTGQWVTNESLIQNTQPVTAFNAFLRKVMNGVHSGTARTAYDNGNSDYYPVALNRNSLRPGVVYADPYGHTFVIVRWVPQSRKKPGILLAVDAQPDGTIAVKRFWKGNFLFNTTEVIGEPGFKTFRPILRQNEGWKLLKNKELTETSGFVPFSVEQQNLEPETFYQNMERMINPEPLDPEEALLNLIIALYEQLQVRVNSVANGEAYFKAHPGAVIPMPSTANGLFQTGGDWENFSTPNRDLRLLIAMDAVLDFPGQVFRFPEDYKISRLTSPEKVRENLQQLLKKRVAELSITYIRTDGSSQQLSIGDILDRRDAFEMAYNPNDGPEIRWGAPENSQECSTCRRKAPTNHLDKMKSFRKWFQQRLHPPT